MLKRQNNQDLHPKYLLQQISTVVLLDDKT
jgi:hypothetical protein